MIKYDIRLTKTIEKMDESNFAGIFYDLKPQNATILVNSVSNTDLYAN